MKLKTGAYCMIMIFLFIFPGEGFQEMKIAEKRRDQLHPAIYNDTVVWEDWRNLRWDIFGYDLSESREIHIARYARYAALYEDIVVWIHYEDQNTEIRGHNLVTGQEFQLAVSSSLSKSETALYKDVVVWTHTNPTSDIYGYNLAMKQEIQIAAHIGDQTHPHIYKDIVVWQDNRNQNWDIYGYNLMNQEEFQVTANPYDQQNPAIYESLVIWEDSRNGNKDIYGYDLVTGQEFQITTDAADQTNPALDGDIIIWEDSRNGTKDIYGYILTAGQEFQVIVGPGDQQNPAIYGNTVIWEDYRSGESDIYGLVLPSNPLDKDGDEHFYPDDCDDNDPEIHPGAQEMCDKKDNNCDGVIDEVCGGTLEIFVINSEGRALQEAQIFIDNIFQGKTDAEGRIFLDVGTHEYTVRVESYGYAPEERKVIIEDMPTIVVVEMNPESILQGTLGILISLVFSLIIIILVTAKLLRARRSPPKKQPSVKLLCPLCRARVKPDWVVCPHCGADLTRKLFDDETRIY